MKAVEVATDNKRLLSLAKKHRLGRLEMTGPRLVLHLSWIILNQSY